MSFKAWTNYPFKDMGDTLKEYAPVRRIEVLEYDGDKYVTVRIEGCDRLQNFKRFYCYKTKACDRTWTMRKFSKLPPDTTRENVTCA